MKAFFSIAAIDLKLAMRNRSVVFFNYLFPLIFFFAIGQMFGTSAAGSVVQLVTMVLVLGTLGNGLFGAGMRAVSEREQNILRRFKVAPITPLPLLAASMSTGWITFFPLVGIVLLLARWMYGMAIPQQWPSLFLMITLGILAFRSIGLIVAAVVNSLQEANILIQILYLPMMFLSGATFPVWMLPEWMQNVAQFLPASHLVRSIQGIMLRGETVAQQGTAIAALVVTTIVATFVSRQLFRWEKEEKTKGRAKLWVLAALLPFLAMGLWANFTGHHLEDTRMLHRDLRLAALQIIRGARIVVGDGRVIDSGTVVIRNGVIESIEEGRGPEAQFPGAEVIEGAGKTLLPGLIDAGVHLSTTGAVEEQPPYAVERIIARNARSHLYLGVTTVRSIADPVDAMLKIQKTIDDATQLGPDIAYFGPVFTVPGGYGLTAAARDEASRAMVRTPGSAAEATQMVAELRSKGIDGLEAAFVQRDGGARLPSSTLTALGAEAAKAGIPFVVLISSAGEAAAAIAAGARGLAPVDSDVEFSKEFLAQLKQQNIVLVLNLGTADAGRALRQGDASPLQGSLVQQTAPDWALRGSLASLRKQAPPPQEPEQSAIRGSSRKAAAAEPDSAKLLRNAHKAGIALAIASRAGRPLLFHGAALHREMELWVKAGLDPATVLAAAGRNAARLLNQQDRAGLIAVGRPANLLLVNGNPLEDIRATGQIAAVYFRGEQIDRDQLLVEQ